MWIFTTFFYPLTHKFMKDFMLGESTKTWVLQFLGLITIVVKKPPLEYSVAIVMGMDANSTSCFFKSSLLISREVTRTR